MAATCVALAEALQTVSHDRLTRLLQADRSGPTRLAVAYRTLFGWARGDRLRDDTVMPKLLAPAMASRAWLESTQACKPGYGLSLVRLIWSKGPRRIPLGLRVWPASGPSTSALAIELIRAAHHRLRCRPESGLYEAWYPAKALLKRRHGYGWDIGSRLKPKRRCNGPPSGLACAIPTGRRLAG
jgi:hypothetical protein